MNAARRLLTTILCLAAPAGAAAQAIEWRLDHRNQPSVLGGVLFEELVATASNEFEGSFSGALADLAVGVPLDDEGGELFLGARLGTGADPDGTGRARRLVAPHLFYRSYAGEEAWKTWFDAGLLLRIEPLVAPSARVGIGVQYDFHENWGAWAGAGASVGYWDALLVGVDAGVGVQFRFGTAG